MSFRISPCEFTKDSTSTKSWQMGQHGLVPSFMDTLWCLNKTWTRLINWDFEDGTLAHPLETDINISYYINGIAVASERLKMSLLWGSASCHGHVARLSGLLIRGSFRTYMSYISCEHVLKFIYLNAKTLGSLKYHEVPKWAGISTSTIALTLFNCHKIIVKIDKQHPRNPNARRGATRLRGVVPLCYLNCGRKSYIHKQLAEGIQQQAPCCIHVCGFGSK